MTITRKPFFACPQEATGVVNGVACCVLWRRPEHVLVLTRKAGERLLIGDDIRITIVKIAGGGVRLGIEAPPELAVIREELQKELREARSSAPRSPLDGNPQ